MAASSELERLRGRLDRICGGGGDGPDPGVFVSGFDRLDSETGGLRRGAVHEVYAAAGADAAAAEGFALGLALRAAPRGLVWIVDRRRQAETGMPCATGVQAWGVDPEGLLLVQVGDAPAVLAAAEDAARSGAVRAVVASGWGEHRAWTLTASRRLALAAAEGGCALMLVRIAAAARSSAAGTRWSVAAAPSVPLAAGAPGRPAFRVGLTRSRNGRSGGEWIMEWDREQRSFVEPQTSGGLVSLPARRPAGARAA